MVSRLHSGFNFDMLGKLPSSSFRVRKVTHRPVVDQQARAGDTRRLDMSSPANWYMLGGDVSRVCWSAGIEAPTYEAVSDTYDPERVSTDRHALHWGSGACWGSVRETLNSGGLEVGAVTDRNATRGVWMARGLSSKRVSEMSNSNLQMVVKRGAAQTGAFPAAVSEMRTSQGPDFGNHLQIPELISSGCADQFSRSQGTAVGFASGGSNYHGFEYSCPISTFSRIGSNSVIPVGFLGA